MARGTVEVVREKTGFSYLTETDAEGFYVVVVHLQDGDLLDALRVTAGRATIRIQARFNPLNSRSNRGTRVDFTGSSAVERQEIFDATVNFTEMFGVPLTIYLLALAFAGSGDQSWLAFAALVPLLVAADGVDRRRAGILGLLSGLIFWLATIPWVAQTIGVERPAGRARRREGGRRSCDRLGLAAVARARGDACDSGRAGPGEYRPGREVGPRVSGDDAGGLPAAHAGSGAQGCQSHRLAGDGGALLPPRRPPLARGRAHRPP